MREGRGWGAGGPARSHHGEAAGGGRGALIGHNGAEPLDRWWVTRVAVAAAALVFVLLAGRLLLDLFAELSHVILLVLFGVVVAVILSPLVEALTRAVRRRSVAVVITALVAVLALAATVALLTVPLVRETRALANEVPRYVAMLSSDQPIELLGVQISGELRQRVGQEIGARAGELSQQAARFALRIGGAVVDLLFVLVLSVYVLASAPTAWAWILGRVPASRRGAIERTSGEARMLFGRYIRGQLILGVIIGVVSGVTYGALGVPYAVFLGVLAGILELVPIVGPIVAGTVAAMLALTEPFPLVVWVIVAATLIQQLENHLLVPRISGGAVGLHPLAALLSVLIGAEVGGIIGAIFAVPFAGLVWSVWRARQHERSAASPDTAARDAGSAHGHQGA